MSYCNGCGGVIGRDCFNPGECEWIAEDMRRREHEQHGYNQAASELDALRAETAQLKAELDKARAERDALEVQLAEAEHYRFANIEAREEIIPDLRSGLTTLQAENERMKQRVRELEAQQQINQP